MKVLLLVPPHPWTILCRLGYIFIFSTCWMLGTTCVPSGSNSGGSIEICDAESPGSTGTSSRILAPANNNSVSSPSVCNLYHYCPKQTPHLIKIALPLSNAILKHGSGVYLLGLPLRSFTTRHILSMCYDRVRP